MIREDMRDALKAGNTAHARELYATLRHFVAAHPEASGRADRESMGASTHPTCWRRRGPVSSWHR